MPANDNWSNEMRKKAMAECVVSQFLVFPLTPSLPLANPLSALAKLLLLLLLDLETQHKIHWNLAVSLPVPAQSY